MKKQTTPDLELTAEEWQRARRLAQELAKNSDRNEFGKVVTYLRRVNNVAKTAELLNRLPRAKFNHSNKTQRYFIQMRDAIAAHLDGLPRQRAILIAFWAFRLMTYLNTTQPREPNHRR